MTMTALTPLPLGIKRQESMQERGSYTGGEGSQHDVVESCQEMQNKCLAICRHMESTCLLVPL